MNYSTKYSKNSKKKRIKIEQNLFEMSKENKERN